MRDDFDVYACDEESQKLFDHPRAAETFGASVFWIRPALLVLETLEEFIAHWQITRDQTRRGIAAMIHNDQELEATQERIAYFQRLLAQLRVTATPAEFPLVASGYRAEVVRMQDEVLAYLTGHASEPVPAEVP